MTKKDTDTPFTKKNTSQKLPWDDYSVLVETVVRWRDLDAYNHINNSVYLNYFEEGRIAYLYKIAEMAGVEASQENQFAMFASTLSTRDRDFCTKRS